MPRAGQMLIQQAIMLQEANHLGLTVTDDDLRQFLHTGQFGLALFPNGQYIGDDEYASLIQNNFGISRQDFETQLKKEIQVNRLRELVTGARRCLTRMYVRPIASREPRSNSNTRFSAPKTFASRLTPATRNSGIL